ncbi:putative baseplate assembly protein [Streptomyces sp. NPDC048161]|uniref:putative baseplate assembly protein n=1 Tax=Streptomyces sp. NPDC048161 TaxID=3160985 RepID=UPI0033C81FFE
MTVRQPLEQPVEGGAVTGTVLPYDPRTRAEITATAAAAVRAALPAWPGQDRSEPGYALLESCTDMAQALRDRLNLAPDQRRAEMLRLLGPRPLPAVPARAEVQFQLSAPAPEPVVIPAGTEVATRPAGGGEPVVFSTLEEGVLNPCVLLTAGMFEEQAAADGVVEGVLSALDPKKQDPFDLAGAPFAGPPLSLNLPYYGDWPFCADTEPARTPLVQARGSRGPQPPYLLGVLSAAVPRTRLTLELTPDLQAGLSAPHLADGVWEAWQGDSWVRCGVVAHDISQQGTARFTLEMPPTHAPAALVAHAASTDRITAGDGASAVWRLADVGLLRYLMPWPYRLKSVTLRPVLTTLLPVCQGSTVVDEVLGTATGRAGERLRFAHPPTLHPTEPLVVEAERDGHRQVWAWVPSLADSGPADQHFTLVPGTGQAVFSVITPGERGPRRHGAPLPAGARVRAPRYRTGGGTAGNVAARTITVLRRPLPYICAVTNPAPATGGTEAETLQDCAARRPLGSPVPERAVTPGDYEDPALAASAGMARVHHVRPADDDALDPAHVYRLSEPARLNVCFTLEPGTETVPKETEVSTAEGIVFTTTATAERSGGFGAGLAGLRLDPQTTGSADPLLATGYQEKRPVTGEFRPGGHLVLALVRLPPNEPLKDLTLWVQPVGRTVTAEDRVALSVFVPRTGTGWWIPDTPAAYACDAPETVPGSGGTLAHPLHLSSSPDWRPDTDPPPTQVKDAVRRFGDCPKEIGGAWLVLQINDPKHMEQTAYTVTADTGTTAEVEAQQYSTEQAGSCPAVHTPGQHYDGVLNGALCKLPPEINVGSVPWKTVPSFTGHGPDDEVVVVNPSSGRIHFGPSTTDQSGTHQHGKVPDEGAVITAPDYRRTLGSDGNGVKKGAVTQLPANPPGVSAVTNTTESSGGTDGYTDTSGGTVQAGVHLRCIPFVTPDRQGWFPFHMLTPSQDAYDTLRRALHARQPPGVPVWLSPPGYRGIQVQARVVPVEYLTDRDRALLAEAAERALYQWFNPVRGGPQGHGWPLGRHAHAGEVHHVLEQVPGVARADIVQLFEIRPPTSTHAEEVDIVACGPDETVYSTGHRVTVAETP